MENFVSTKVIEMGSCAFRQWRATSHCHLLHGYHLTAKFWFTSDELDHRNWVFDFGDLDGLKKTLADMYDHTTCVAADDPELDVFTDLHNKGIIDIRIFPNGVGIERTAEQCWIIADSYVRSKSENKVRCLKVEVFEHPKNSAVFETKHNLS